MSRWASSSCRHLRSQAFVAGDAGRGFKFLSMSNFGAARGVSLAPPRLGASRCYFRAVRTLGFPVSRGFSALTAPWALVILREDFRRDARVQSAAA